MTKKEPEAFRVDYCKINPECYVCKEPGTVMRCTMGTDGNSYFSTMCEEHARGEQKYIVENDGMEPLPSAPATFFNVRLIDKMGPFAKPLLEAMDSDG